MNFMWRGEPITDIKEWCRIRGEQMVRVLKTWREPMPFAGRIEDREEVIEMPASFYDGTRFGGPFDVNYREVGRYTP